MPEDALVLPEGLQDQQDLLAMYDLITSRLSCLVQRNYVPHEGGPDGGQLAAHKSQAKIKMVASSNRFGKTRWALQEINWWMSHSHPYRKVPERPIMARTVAEGFDYGVNQVIIPLLRDFVVDPKLLKGGTWETAYSSKEHCLYYADGGRWQFMSYRLADMGRGTQIFGGVDLDIVHHDETSPNDIWEENLARLVRYDGSAILTLTPVLGMTWEYEQIYKPWEEGTDDSIACFRGSMWDNPYLPRVSVDRYAKSIHDETTRNIRLLGLWQSIGGRVYPTYNSETHFVDPDPRRIRDAMKFVFIDPAPSKPVAVLWCGVDHLGMFAYQEMRLNGTPQEVAKEIRARSAAQRISDFYMDPHWGWKNQDARGTSTKSQYIEAGIPVRDATDDKWGRMSMLQDALEVDPISQRPRFVVFKTCPRLDFEFKYKQYKPQKEGNSYRPSTIDRDDDVLTCAEYFVAIKPASYYVSTIGEVTYPHLNVTAMNGRRRMRLQNAGSYGL